MRTLIEGLIQTDITFGGTLSSWWTKIALAMLVLILPRRGLTGVGERRATGVEA
jgi:hypothetical protein